MEMSKTASRMTVEEYLKTERESEERHYYLDGEVFAMAGESDAHGIITVNLVALLVIQLKGTQCQVRTKDTRVRSGPQPTSSRNMTGLYSYPDIVVICGKPEYSDERKDILLNPKVVIEVLSPSTEAFDRGKKFTRFQTWNPTLTDYLLVSQDEPQIEHFQSRGEVGWSFQRYAGLETTVAIPSIQCSLKLADVYDRVVFENQQSSGDHQ